MIEKLAALPRWVYVIVLVVSVLGWLPTLLSSAALDTLPITTAPFEYWFYLGLALLCFLGMGASLYFLFRPRGRLSSSIAVVGLFEVAMFLLQMTHTPWTGNTVGYAVAAVILFAIALFVRIEETKRNKRESAETS